MKKFLKITGIVLILAIIAISGIGVYVKTALPDTGPAEKITVERTPERIERGKYLANHVAVCMDCHSKRDWTLFAGPMAVDGFGAGGEVFDQKFGFPGSFHSKNITPYALGTWSDGDILKAITTGVSKTGKALFPIMGYQRFGKMDREDVLSIIAYLRTLTPVASTIPESIPDFPVNFIINTMPQKAAFTKRPAETDVTAYGAYLINVAGCVECHSKRDKGNVVAGTEFGGGMEFPCEGGIVRSPNITFDEETGIGNWSKEGFVQRFKSFADSNYHAARMSPGDLNTQMPWSMYAGMKRSDLEAIYTYLKTIKPIRNEVKRYEKKS